MTTTLFRKPCGNPRQISENNYDWEWVQVSWTGVTSQQFLSDFNVVLQKARRCFYIVSNRPVSEVFMHFIPLRKYMGFGTGGWQAGQGGDTLIPFPGSGRQALDVNNMISDICSIEFDEETRIKQFFLSAYNGTGATPNELTILCSSKPIKFFNSKT